MKFRDWLKGTSTHPLPEPPLHAELREALAAVERGETVERGDFSQYGDEPERVESPPAGVVLSMSGDLTQEQVDLLRARWQAAIERKDPVQPLPEPPVVTPRCTVDPQLTSAKRACRVDPEPGTDRCVFHPAKP